MSLWVIDKQAMAPFVARLIGDYRVVGPVAKGVKFAFGQIEEPGDLRLDYNTSILPPKKYLQPQEERMMTFSRSGAPLAERVLDAPPTVILGIHTCDLHGLKVLDKAFSQGFPDAHYLERRKNTWRQVAIGYIAHELNTLRHDYRRQRHIPVSQVRDNQ